MSDRAGDTATKSTVRNPHLQLLLQNTEVILSAANALFENYTAAQLNWSPGPKKWSALQCVDHLYITGNRYYPGIKKAIEETREKGLKETKPFRPSLFGNLFIRMMNPKSKLKLKTVRIFTPEPDNPSPNLEKNYIAQIHELIGMIRDADGLDLNTIKLVSPATSMLKLSIGEGLWLQVVHQQRHLLQAKNLRTMPGFPER